MAVVPVNQSSSSRTSSSSSSNNPGPPPPPPTRGLGVTLLILNSSPESRMPFSLRAVVSRGELVLWLLLGLTGIVLFAPLDFRFLLAVLVFSLGFLAGSQQNPPTTPAPDGGAVGSVIPPVVQHGGVAANTPPVAKAAATPAAPGRTRLYISSPEGLRELPVENLGAEGGRLAVVSLPPET